MMNEVSTNLKKISGGLEPIANIFNKNASKILATKLFKNGENADKAGTITSGVLSIVSIILLSLAGLFLLIGMIRSIVARVSTKGDVEINKRKAIRIFVYSLITAIVLGVLGAIYPVTISFLHL